MRQTYLFKIKNLSRVIRRKALVVIILLRLLVQTCAEPLYTDRIIRPDSRIDREIMLLFVIALLVYLTANLHIFLVFAKYLA